MLEDLDLLWRDYLKGPEAREGLTAEEAQVRVAAWLQLAALLPNQPLLRQNLIMYAVRKEVQEQNEFLLYGLAYAVPSDPAYMADVLPPNRFKVVWKPPEQGQQAAPDPVNLDGWTGWHIEIEVICIRSRLPTISSMGRFCIRA
jgi:hypothetical protein